MKVKIRRYDDFPGVICLHMLGGQGHAYICYRHWLKAGGAKVNIGEEPISVDLTLICTPVAEKKKKKGGEKQ